MNRIESRGQISQRELEVLELICNQFTTTEIARRLYISPRTVEGHRNNLMNKVNRRNTAGLVAYAVTENLVRLYE